jgi:hypothetical protein
VIIRYASLMHRYPVAGLCFVDDVGACVPARAVQGSVRAIFEIESQRKDPVRVEKLCQDLRVVTLPGP